MPHSNLSPAGPRIGKTTWGVFAGLVAVSVFLILIVATGCNTGGPTGTPSTATPGGIIAPLKVDGVLQNIDSISGKLQVSTQDGKTYDIVIDPDTKVTVTVKGDSNQQDGTEADLRSGATVQVQYDAQTGKARRIDVYRDPERTDEPASTARPGDDDRPPAIPHAVQGREDCLSCHGPNGIKPFPANHAGRTNNTCTSCHQSGSTSSGTPGSTARPGDDDRPPAIPHAVQGRADCTACHGPNGIKPFPADHAGRNSSTCLTCHQPALATGTAQPTQITQRYPVIPHTILGREDCLSCHSRTGIEPFPSSHVGRTNSMCSSCHQPASSQNTTGNDADRDEEDSEGSNGTPPAIPHAIQGRENCLSCHSQIGIEPFPASHMGRTNDVCTTCHK